MGRSPLLSRRRFAGLAATAAAFGQYAGQSFAAKTDDEGPLVGYDQCDPTPTGTSDLPWLGLKVGLASYSFSKLPLGAAIAGIRRVGVNYVSIKDAHLSLKSTAEERKAIAQKFRDAGITPLSCGVITMPNDESQLRNAFEYARDAGIPTIVCKPTRECLPLLDKLVKEFGLHLAIHNHGPEDNVWPSPLDVWTAIQKYDERIGVCVDVGHTARCGVDPVQALRQCAPRLYDVHLKDLSGKEGKSRPVEVGRGVLDVRGMLKALLDIGYRHHVGLEYEKDMADPIPGVAESFGFIRGTLAAMGQR
jgi:sugar phosphate isomerase/epimerase